MFWDDEGVAQFIRYFEPGLEAEFYALPSKVEQSDVFRVLVCKWLGGVVRPLYFPITSSYTVVVSSLTSLLSSSSTSTWTLNPCNPQ
jgi:hypothetical protein